MIVCKCCVYILKQKESEKMLKFPCQLPKLMLKLNKVTFGNKLRLIGWPFIFKFSNAKISIGNSVTINSNFWSNLLGLYQRTIIVAKKKGEITIGDKVGISGATIYAWDKIEIGDKTLIGANVKIVDNDFHPVDAEARFNNNNSATKTAPVKIGKNCFIGMNSIILKGTEIGDNCTVGAGSVVHGKFEANCVIAGNPAKIIKHLEK